LPPNYLHVFELVAVKPPPGNSEALQHHVVQILIGTETRITFVLGVGGLLGRSLGIGQIDELVAGEVRINNNVEQGELWRLLTSLAKVHHLQTQESTNED
jgi:hypothetical protein